LSRKGEPQQIIQQVVNNWGNIDVLVNNARSGIRTSLFEESEESWEQAISVTLKAAFFASQEAIKQMSITGGGAIVNISSVASHLVCKESPVYHIAKAGITQMTRYLAMHAGVYNIRVNCVVPGFIIQDEHMNRYRAESNKHYKKLAEFCHPLGNTGTSNDVADAVLFLCSTQSAFITGQNIVVDGGLTIQEQSNLIFNFDEHKK
jgi:3-oxoacyl-[acyl-carrier protein] reductase